MTTKLDSNMVVLHILEIIKRIISKYYKFTIENKLLLGIYFIKFFFNFRLAILHTTHSHIYAHIKKQMH